MSLLGLRYRFSSGRTSLNVRKVAVCLRLSLVALTIVAAIPLLAHSWYPLYCCGDRIVFQPPAIS